MKKDRSSILILSAMPQEARGLLSLFQDIENYSIFGFDYWKGRLGETPIVIGVTGAGKSQAAFMTGYFIQEVNPELIIYTGIAGALNSSYRIGDVLVTAECLQWDMDVSSLGLSLGEIPGRGLRIFTPPDKLLNKLKSHKTKGYRLHFGRVLTGDRFVVTPDSIPLELQGDAVDMEGASAALVAELTGLPFLMIRLISDVIGSDEKSGFAKVTKLAGKRIGELLPILLSYESCP